MIDFYYAPTPNGWKVAIMLEETGLEYRLHLMNLADGDQFTPEFLDISPNAKMPAIVRESPDGERVTVFESGAILHDLARLTDSFLGDRRLPDKALLEWLFWQAANLGPMGGQLSHFVNYAPEQERGYSLRRYRGEYERCLTVLDRWLSDREYLLDEYSIADMMAFPWAFIARKLGVSLDPYPAVTRWRAAIKERPAVRRAIDLHKDAQLTGKVTADSARRLFNQSSRNFGPDAG